VPTSHGLCQVRLLHAKGLYRCLLLEGKEHLLQEIPLGEAEHAAVEEGVAAHEKLLLKLADVPTPAGPTQRQISTGLIQITTVRPHLMSRYYKSKDGTIAASEVV
jgi:hypothetical protein